MCGSDKSVYEKEWSKRLSAEMANTVIKMNSGKISEIYTNEAQKTAYEIGW